MPNAQRASHHDPSGDVALVTGATGYVGGRLVNALVERGRTVRAMARDPEDLGSRIPDGVVAVRGDVLKPASLRDALRGVSVAYYLVHSMGASRNYEDADREGAANFAKAAEEAGVRRIVYLGGLGEGEDLSPHLRSRQEVGRVLRGSGVPTIEFRASIVIGSGSISYELVRGLVEKLPVMLTPDWVRVETQPIAVEDLIDYLSEAVDVEVEGSRVFEIGGADQVSYAQLMREYARQRGLRRVMIPVPVLTPRLSSLWLGLVTPLYARVGRKLVDGVRNRTVVKDPAALAAFSVRPRGIEDAIARALVNEDRRIASTRWSDTRSLQTEASSWGGTRLGSRIVDSRRRTVAVSGARAFEPVRKIGGKVGWYYGDWLWRTRGFLDLLFGGVGTRRGRRDPETPVVGEPLDFWRVEQYEPGRLLRLRAEMKLPGRAWLQFEVEPAAGGCEIVQTAEFDPRGILGRLYWYALYPLHHFVFAGMLDGLVAAIPSSSGASATPSEMPPAANSA